MFIKNRDETELVGADVVDTVRCGRAPASPRRSTGKKKIKI